MECGMQPYGPPCGITISVPTLSNGFLERIMPDVLEEYDVKVSIGGKYITNLRFADDIA